MNFKIEKYDKSKHREKLLYYLKKIEKKFEYVPFFLSIDILEMFSTFKNIFVIIKNEKVINLGYKNEIKSNLGFFFEKPKHNYNFLKDFDSVAVYFPFKQEINKINYEEKIEITEAIINIPKVVSLNGKDFKTLRGKINKFKKENSDFIIEIFDKKKISYNKIKTFYEEWRKSSEKRKNIDMSLYDNCLKFIFNFNGHFDGIVVKKQDKIIGVAFFSKSPLGKQSIGITSNAFCEFKGLNDFLTYQRYNLVHEKYKINIMNIGSANSDPIINMKKKFGFFREKFLILVLKGKNLRTNDFWHDDCVDPDDF